MARYTVVTMPGDGIGKVVLTESVRVLEAVGFDAEYVHGDITNTRLSSGIFDSVVCYSSFPHFNDKKRALDEIYRVLKVGCRIFICTCNCIVWIAWPVMECWTIMISAAVNYKIWSRKSCIPHVF